MGSSEFFYIDKKTGKRSDRDLHALILGAVEKFEEPIDEDIMRPIRERYRAKTGNKAKHLQGVTLRRARDYVTGARDFDPNQPRDSYGRWTDTGAGDKPSQGDRRPEAQPAPAAAAGANARGLSNSYGSRSASDAERSRHVIQVWTPDVDGVKLAEKLGVTPQTFHQLNSITGGAGRFHAAITAAKGATKYGASVYAYGAEEYEDMRLFLTPDGKSGFAVKGDDIVSAFKHPETEGAGYINSALALATKMGGRRLDAFDTVLPRLYGDAGFRAVARLPWDDDQKPPDWDYETYKAFNGGRPDVVFMVYDPDHPVHQVGYRKGDGAGVWTYNDGIHAQKAALRAIDATEEIRQNAPPPPAMSREDIQKSINKVAKDLDFNPEAIAIDEGEHKFELNGQQYRAAGVAFTSMVEFGDKDNILISLFRPTLRPDFIDGLIAHEIEHIKFEHALNRYRDEQTAINKEPNRAGEYGIDQVMRADGSLKPPYDQKYPAYTLMHEAFFAPSHADFARSDGVTNYSIEWWKNWKEKEGQEGSGHSALHETLAEMAKIKYTTGKFPTANDYFGHHSLAWRTPKGGDPIADAAPKPSQAQMEENAKLWRNLYRAIDKVWKL